MLYLQRVCGYCLTGDTSAHEFYIFHGSGRNGKSTFVKTLTNVLGDYAASARIETFLTNKKNSGGSSANSDIARLAGARLVTAGEGESGRRLAEAMVKEMSGGDTITARFLYREEFQFDAQFKLIMFTNHRPIIKGTDVAIWERIRLIPFEVFIPKEQRDETLRAKLDAELPGVLRWCVEGAVRWYSEGFGKLPQAVIAACKAYREEMDVLGDFLADCCDLESQGTVATSELYGAYMKWCDEQKFTENDRLKQKAFGQSLAERGLESKRNNKQRFWCGIRLNV
jgi:putative DNA primase/helicase